MRAQIGDPKRQVPLQQWVEYIGGPREHNQSSGSRQAHQYALAVLLPLVLRLFLPFALRPLSLLLLVLLPLPLPPLTLLEVVLSLLLPLALDPLLLLSLAFDPFACLPLALGALPL